MKTFNVNTINNDEWITPPYIIEALGNFDLDPCSPIIPPFKTADHYFTKVDDSLNKKWFGRVWLNPPYGKMTFPFMKKLADHGNGIALIASRTETIGFHDQVLDRATSIFFFKGRLKFHYVNGDQGGTAGFPSLLVSYGVENSMFIDEAKHQGKIKGKHILL